MLFAAWSKTSSLRQISVALILLATLIFFIIYIFVKPVYGAYLGGDPVIPKKQAHPTLFFNPYEIPDLQQKA